MARNVHFTGIPDSIVKGAKLAAEVRKVAEEVAANARGQGVRVEGEPGDVSLPIEVDSYFTDRARSSVTIKHPSGLAAQAKNGVLTRAASQAGLEVNGE